MDKVKTRERKRCYSRKPSRTKRAKLMKTKISEKKSSQIPLSNNSSENNKYSTDAEENLPSTSCTRQLFFAGECAKSQVQSCSSKIPLSNNSFENNSHAIDAEDNLASTSCTREQENDLVNLEDLWCSKETYNSITNHSLYFEKSELPIELDSEKSIPGNRIVQLGYVLKWAITLQYQHSKVCTCGMLYVSREIRRGLGLVSHIEFKCTMCNIEIVKATENPNLKKSVINTGAVWGTLSTGSTYGHLEETFSCMDIPCFNKHIFYNKEKELEKVWFNELWLGMEQTGQDERNRAIELGHVDPDGTPYITVFLDGGWSKRSYGHNYNASSGVAVIIGEYTGKVLFLSVRNKYCSICQRAANKGGSVIEHICYRNWSGSSSAMEQDIVVEGFCKSEEQHGLRYKNFIADGDSSVFANIRTKVPYGRFVKKTECSNHVIKNYGKAVRQIKQDKAVSLEARQQLKIAKIEELQKVAYAALYQCALERSSALQLTEELKNGIEHVFGEHSKCQTYYCGNEKESKGDNNELAAVKLSGLYHHLSSALELVLRKSSQLVDNKTNNRAELFMSILARFNAGKRINLTNRGSFQNRCSLAGMRYNKGVAWHASPYKKEMEMSPGVHMKKYIQKSMQETNKQREWRNNNLKEKRKQCKTTPNADYGPKANQEDPCDDDLAAIKSGVLDRLHVSEERRNEIAALTVGQFDNDFYKVERGERLTASNFGAVVSRRKTTRCHSLVKNILYPQDFTTSCMSYGKKNEIRAKKMLEEKLDITIKEAGLFIDVENPCLAASPDGLVGNNKCVEVKCIPKLIKLGLSLREGTVAKKTCLEIDGDRMRLKRNHAYYYQVQGQLNILHREQCYFVVYVSDDEELFIEIIDRDERLWKETMLPKLLMFYNDCILEEIARRRWPRGEKCYDPKWIEDAINAQGI